MKFAPITWVNNNVGATVVICFVVAVLIYMWSWMASPYNPQYWVKRALWTPTFVCRDGVYSWAKGASGTCSNHGGIERKYQ